MKKYGAVFCLIALGFAGCASVPPPARVSTVVVTRAPGKDVHILDAYIKEIDGCLVVCGKARQAFQWTPVVPTHVDVQFLDGKGQELTLKSVAIQLQRRRSTHVYPSPANFQIPSEPWPEGTARIVVGAHAGAAHQP